MIPAGSLALLKSVEAAWAEASLDVITGSGDRGRIIARVSREQLDEARAVAARALESPGCRTCADPGRGVCSLFGFSGSGCICIDLTDGRKRRAARIFGRSMPIVALLGPDGVGKSTTLRLVQEWFAREAPFIDITVRQWRPSLLPPLAALLGKGGGDGVESDFRPRRNRGNLQWIRLPYYFLDFLLGSWWKDRNRGAGSRLIIYDRCALDMYVDPYRFGLASAQGTRLLWRMTPRPRSLVLLYDSAARIAQRKDDLTEPEIAEQLGRWLKLAEEDEVHSVIRVDSGPEDVADRVRAVMVHAFTRHHEPCRASADSEAVAQTAALLGGEGLDGREYVVLPGRSNPKFLVPLGTRAVAAASLTIYNAQRPVARLAKAILRTGLRTGLAQPFLRDRIRIDATNLERLLREVAAQKEVSIAVSLGTPGPNRKPALQVMSPDGRVVAYAKIGWNSATIPLLRNEADALRRLEESGFTGGIVPRLLYAGQFGDNYLLVQCPVGCEVGQAVSPAFRSTDPKAAHANPSQGRLQRGERKRNRLPHLQPDLRHVHFLAELHRLDASEGAIRCPGEDDIDALQRRGFHYYAHLLEWARIRCERAGSAPLGPAHRDFTPWNIRADGDKLVVFDWELFEPRVPAGWDLFHLMVAGAVEVQSATPATIYASIAGPGAGRDLIEEYFRLIGADPRLIEPLFVAYAADALRAGVLDLAENSSEKDRELQRTWAALLALARHRGPADASALVEPAALEGVR